MNILFFCDVSTLFINGFIFNLAEFLVARSDVGWGIMTTAGGEPEQME